MRMERMVKAALALGAMGCALVCCSARLAAQQYQGLPSVNAQTPLGQSASNEDTLENRQIHEKQIKALNKMRQETMVADAAKLLKLAQELSSDADKNLTPAERMKKLAEIEKLAKSVREKMSYGVWMNSGPQATPFSVATQ